MADDVTFTGLSNLQAMFKDLPAKLAEAGLRRAAFAGANLICEQAKVNVSRGQSGTLAAAIITKRIEEKSGPFIQTYKVCVRKGKYGGPDGYYGHWVEYGHLSRAKGQALRGSKTSVKNQRAALLAGGAAHVPAHPYMRPAYDAKAEEAVAVIKEELINRIKQLTS